MSVSTQAMALSALQDPSPQSSNAGAFCARLSALVGEKLTLAAFPQLCGKLSGYQFIKIVYDRRTDVIHFLNHNAFAFHVDYFGEKILGYTPDEVSARLDELNRQAYHDPQRPVYLGVLCLHHFQDRRFFTLETVEVDTMDENLFRDFFQRIRVWVDHSIPLYLKPASHLQESYVEKFDPVETPRILNHELYGLKDYIPLNPGSAMGRLRIFNTTQEFNEALASLEWFDIICTPRIPDNIPRVTGLINSDMTTPLSHTNVLAHGWQIPNAIQIGIIDELTKQNLNGQWIQYTVSRESESVHIEKQTAPEKYPQKPNWSSTQITLDTPEIENVPILPLSELRIYSKSRYGTKAANLGELHHILKKGSERLTGFYRIARPPRENLLPYLKRFLNAESGDLNRAAWEFLRLHIRIPRGIALPFSLQQEFLASSPKIQQTIGKIKMALELKARDIEPLCLSLQNMIRDFRMSESLRESIDREVTRHLAGVKSFVIRSSSNAEDLDGFSAAGIYESINHVTSADNLFKSIKDVWASLLSARSIRLRHDVGIALDDCYMGVIIQEEIPSEMGGVLVTLNPAEPKGDFRHVYVNAANSSVEVVQGKDVTTQFLFNTVEGNGMTVSLAEGTDAISEAHKQCLTKLAFASRLFQSHYSPNYTFENPLDIEWLISQNEVFILQIRPYGQ